MKLAIILSALFSTFATTVPNLCDDVFVDALGQPVTDAAGQTLSRYCAWTGPDAPVWDADVCCTFDDDDSAVCSAPRDGRCASGTARMYCEHGIADALGGVTCYQPLPDACAAGMCVQAPEIPPAVQKSHMGMCCSPSGVCMYIPFGTASQCQGEIMWCGHGYVDTTGFAECWD